MDEKIDFFITFYLFIYKFIKDYIIVLNLSESMDN